MTEPVRFAAERLPKEVWGPALGQLAHAGPRWLWHGYLAAGHLTLFTSQWKSGKTTLVSLLLARMDEGGDLAGLAVAPGKAVVVSEEDPSLWAYRCQKLGFGRHVWLLCRPFLGPPSFEEWDALIDHLLALHEEHGLSLAVIDPLAVFLPGNNENSASVMAEALAPLGRLTARGLAVLLLHHPSKEERAAGMAARGSGALPGFADIILEMSWYRDSCDRRRRLRAFSRHEQTPRHLVIELNADGTDYLPRPDLADAFAEAWELVRQVLVDAGEPLTRGEVLAGWPPDARRPNARTLWRWLDHAVAARRLLRSGTGLKNDPFRYRVPDGKGLPT
jgi:hypothetical protein